MKKTEIILEQEASNFWVIKGPKGNPLSGRMVFCHKFEAEEFAKAFVSSFVGWNYKVKELNNGSKVSPRRALPKSSSEE